MTEQDKDKIVNLLREGYDLTAVSSTLDIPKSEIIDSFNYNQE